jgi:hypothetical protein
MNAGRLKATTSLAGAMLCLGALAFTPACERREPPAFVKSGKLGVFFGGQVEERRELPFELDPAKQTQGFRVEFSQPLATDTDVEWRVDMPNPDARRRRSKANADPPPSPTQTLSGKDIARAGEKTLDHVLVFHPGDPLGLWNVRVVVRDKVVIDRPVEVFDAAQRKRLAPPDAG